MADDVKKIEYVSPKQLGKYNSESKKYNDGRYLKKGEGGTSSYEDLADKPTLDGTTIEGTLTSADLGLAKTSQLPKAATASAIGLVKPDDSTIKVDSAGTVSANFDGLARSTDIPGVATSSKAGTVKPGSNMSVSADGTITADLSNCATNDSVTSAVSSAKSELQEEIASAVSSIYKPAGSVAFKNLPTPAKSLVGNVYNVTDAFVTDTKFVEGAGHDYPAGTNVAVVNPSGTTYQFDAMAGFIDLSGYVKESEFVDITDSEIEAMFA